MAKYFVFIALTASFACGQNGGDRPLTNETVIKMVASGVPPETVIMTIRVASSVNFGFLPNDLDLLQRYHVPDDVVKAMSAKSYGRPVPQASAPLVQASPQQPPSPRAPNATTAGPLATPVSASKPGSSAGVFRTDNARDWKIGRVIDSRIAKSSTPVGTVTNTTSTATGTATGTATATTMGNTTVATGTAYGYGTSQSTSNTDIMFANIRDNQLVILGDEFGYVVEDTRVSGGGGGLVGITVHAIANRKHGCRFIVGDNISYRQARAVLHVLDADGKECKTDILRQERLN